MNKTIIKVFLILAVLVAVFLVWELFFAKNGIMHSVYNGMAAGVNKQWQKLTGDASKDLIPMWDQDKDSADTYNDNKDKNQGGGFKIDVSDN